MSEERTVILSANENPVTFTGTISPFYSIPCGDKGGFEIDHALGQFISMASHNKLLANEHPKHGPETRALARQTLRKINKDPDIESNTCELLAATLCDYINRFIDYISEEAITIAPIRTIPSYNEEKKFLKENIERFVSKSRNGAFEIDVLFAIFIRNIGQEGLEIADEIEKKSIDRMASWDGSGWSLDKSVSLHLSNTTFNETMEIRPPWLLWITETTEECEPGICGEKGNSFSRFIRFPRIFHILAHVLLIDLVDPQIARQEKFKTAALPIGVIERTHDAFNAATIEPLDNGNYALRSSSGEVVSLIDVGDVSKATQRQVSRHQKTAGLIFSNEEILQRIEAARGVAGQLLLRKLTWIGYQQDIIENRRDPRRYEQPGGPTALTKSLGLDTCYTSNVIDALDGFQLARIPIPGKGHASLMGWDHYPPAASGRGKKGQGGGREALAVIILMDALMPGFVFDMPSSFRSEREDRRLSPMPHHNLQPALQGSTQSYAAQLALQINVLEYLTINAEEYVTRGLKIPITNQQWKNLFDKSEVPFSYKDKILDAYSTGTGRKAGTPFLRKDEVGNFRLTEEHKDSKDQIEQTGKFYISRAAGGKALSESKQKLNKNKSK